MTKKYEFTGETKEWCGITLKRIRATTDFTHKCGIRAVKGDLGGWIEREENLSHMDSAWVSGDAAVYGNARVYDNAWVTGSARVNGNAEVYGDARVCGGARVSGSAWVGGNAWVGGYAWVSGSAKVGGNAEVNGNAEVYGEVEVYGDAGVYGDAKVCGDAKVEKMSDIIWFKNIWTSGRTFTYTRSNDKWKVGCFYGTGEELIKKAYKDSKVSGKCYKTIVRATKEIYKALADIEKGK